MPQRHSDGSAGSSSSSGSSSWHSSSSWSTYNRYDNDGPSSPEQQMLGLIMLGVFLVILAVFWIGDQVNKANQRRDNANATATTAAITAQDLAELHAALDGRISEWKKVGDGAVHHVGAPDAGLDDGNTKEVLYGYCTVDQFYVYVLEMSRPGGYFTDTEGYAYTPGSYPNACHPEGFYIASDDNVGGGWHFITMRTDDATFRAMPTMTIIPRTGTPALPAPTRTPESKQ